jgi:hypothetical protein
MGHQRYVIKNGKRYGPYTYHSYRDEYGNVKKRYLGKSRVEVKKGELLSVSFFIFLFLFSMGMIGKILWNTLF